MDKAPVEEAWFEPAKIDLPKPSSWSCELFGMGPLGIVFRPKEGTEPNWFWRWMQYLILGNRWIKDKQ